MSSCGKSGTDGKDGIDTTAAGGATVLQDGGLAPRPGEGMNTDDIRQGKYKDY